MIFVQRRAKLQPSNLARDRRFQALICCALPPKRGERDIQMKKMMKTLAMLSLSACVLTGGAVSSFAASAGTSRWTPIKTTTCSPDDEDDECTCTEDGDTCSCNCETISYAYTNDDGTVTEVHICPRCGDVNNDETTLSKHSSVTTTSNFDSLRVRQGTLSNGEKVMTVSFYYSGSNAVVAEDSNRRIEMPASKVEGYTLMLVNPDGSETPIETTNNGKKVSFTVNIKDGAQLIHLVANN